MVNPFYQSVNFLSIAHIAIGRYFIDREDIAKMKDVDVGPIGGYRIRPCVLLQVGGCRPLSLTGDGTCR